MRTRNGDGRARRLTAPTIARYKPRDCRYEISDSTRGLRLVVEPTGTKAWAFRYRHPGSGVSACLWLGRVDLDRKESADSLRHRIAQLEDENRRLRAMLRIPHTPTSKKVGDSLSVAAARRLAVEIEHQRRQGIDVGAEYQLEKGRRRAAAAECEINAFAVLRALRAAARRDRAVRWRS
jgi:Arm DNA-binding domain